MKKYLSMAALALVGAMMTGCSNEDDGVSNPQQPENQSKSVTLTATIGLDGGITRALTATGVKTFADGETMAIIYKNNSGNTVKAVSNPLNGSGDIADGGKNAKFTFTLDNPDRTQDVTYIYPAAMAGETDVDYTKLNSQSGGTLADLGSKYDLCTKSGAWNGGNLPTLTLENQLAILAVTLKNSTGSSEITSGITSMTISDGTNNYTVTRSAAAGPIYVAIRPTIFATINITATDGTTYYTKSLTGKTYEANNGYNVSWKMAALPEGALSGKFTINGSGNQVRFSKGNLQYTKSTSTWSFMEQQYSTVETNASPYCTDDYGDKDVVSLFGWATSGYNHGATCYQPYSTNKTSSSYYAYGDKYKNLYDQTGQADWGYNAISNGGNTENSGWRTLTSDEWRYLFNTRTTGGTVFGTSSARYAHATIRTDVSGGVNGIILFPDGLSIAASEVTTAGTVNSASDWGTKCTSSQWNALAAKGCVFLPAAGRREGSAVTNVGAGSYWSSTAVGNNYAKYVYFNDSSLGPDYSFDRYKGHSVRLVRAVE